ncbi:unnamed protein product [Acanthosepion pharaonis]|uniref:Helitron helicase-like domain-containing protein n=1 Tax=Acanthosepion pharaonis TaxID=158019 RepID=A0A812C6Z5_ACAPH|nr:unnamed protein product [Sepia pharaonis]
MQPTPLQLPFDGPRRPRLRKPHVTKRKLRQRPFDGPRNPWLRNPHAMQLTPLQIPFDGPRRPRLRKPHVTNRKLRQSPFDADCNQQADAGMAIIPENDTGQHNHPRRDIIMSLQQMLHETNNYVRSFKYALENNTSDFIIVIDADKRPQGQHERLYNAPASNEVSVIVSSNQHNRRDIVIESRGSGLRRISETHRSYDALQYPLLSPYGEDGYHFLQNGSTLKTVSCRAFYAYLLMVHEGAFNHLHRSRQLFHQFIVDMAAKMESERLCYIRPSCAATLTFISVMLYEMTLIHAI